MSSEEALGALKSLGEVTPEQKQDLVDMFDKVKGVFSTLPGRTNYVTHDIELTTDKAIPVRYYRHGKHEWELTVAEVKRMLRLGLIRESTSPMEAP